MNHLQERMERLLDEPWLERDVAAIEVRATSVRSRQRRTLAVGALALLVVLAIGAAIAGRPDQGGAPTSLDVAGLPDRGYVEADSQLIIFVGVGAPAADRQRLRQQLVDDPVVGQAWWISGQDAYDEFRCLFADQPEMIESVTPDILPSSYDVALVDGADQAAFVAGMRANPAVAEVVVAPTEAEVEASGTSVPWRPAQARCDGTPRAGDAIK